MIEEIKKIAEEEYDPKDFKYHIKAVVKNALLLQEKLGGDKEVIEVSAYLHDIGKGKNREKKEMHEGHHITGEKRAIEILKTLGADKDFIKKVAHCVLSHRGSKDPKPETLEAKIVNNADAMAHFDAFPELLKHFLETSEFENSILKISEKIDRDWDVKLSLPKAREIIKPKYLAAKLLIDSMKEYIV